jgi:flavin reductase (DIM6/NTAB) family NADH-FMN oxidoreductase RutF
LIGLIEIGTQDDAIAHRHADAGRFYHPVLASGQGPAGRYQRRYQSHAAVQSTRRRAGAIAGYPAYAGAAIVERIGRLWIEWVGAPRRGGFPGAAACGILEIHTDDPGCRSDSAVAGRFIKTDLPVSRVRRYLEPGPIVLVSSALGGRRNLMTMGWHTMMEFTPSLIGCVIASSNYSFDLIRDSGECVLNVPTIALTDAVVGIGNTSGADLDKFQHFGLTAAKARRVQAPLVAECYANFECRLADDALVQRYNFFIFEVVTAHVARSPRHPRTLHYTGDGVFMVAGRVISRRRQFRPELL